jgi:hypothetical protein
MFILDCSINFTRAALEEIHDTHLSGSNDHMTEKAEERL